MTSSREQRVLWIGHDRENETLKARGEEGGTPPL